MRAWITQELIEKKGFIGVAVEADWPDAAHFDHHIHGTSPDPMLESWPFSRFPTWMWANHSVLEFVYWLRAHNEKVASTENEVGFYGLDLYSLSSSIEAVLSYLEMARNRLLPERLERAIGVIYRPDAELQSHYFYVSMPQQFDEYVWFDETRAVEPVVRETTKGPPETFPLWSVADSNEAKASRYAAYHHC